MFRDLGDVAAWLEMMESDGESEEVVSALTEAISRAADDPGFAQTEFVLDLFTAVANR